MESAGDVASRRPISIVAVSVLGQAFSKTGVNLLKHQPPNAKPPTVYWVWLAGLAWTSIGTSVLSFGLVWTATGRSAALGGLVLTMVIVPRVVLMLVGGSVADRVGPGRVMIVSDVTFEHFVANERAGAFYEREGFVAERIDPSPTDKPALGVVWRARQLTRSE